MLDKLPPEIMARILPLMTPVENLQLASASGKLLTLVTATPKKHGIVKCIMEDGALCLSFSPGPDTFKVFFLPIDVLIASLEWEAENDHGIVGLMGGSGDLKTRVFRTVFFRVLFDNSTIDEFVDAPLSFGNEFWFSLNMKVTRFTEPKAAASVAQLQQFLEHFQPTELIYNHLFVDFIARVAECERFLRSDFIRGLKKLHLFAVMGNVECLLSTRAKDFLIGITGFTPRAHLNSIFAFLLRRISDWLHGDEEIDKIQICAGKDIEADKIFGRLVNRVAARMTSDIGWIDRTYEGMELILRASDGQALLVFWDDADGFFYLIRCEYNYRRGRCLGSFQRNEDSLRRIRQLMSLSKQLLDRNAELAENASEKLKNECLKFNAYNNGATTIDLMTDWIWRPKGERRSPWGLVDRIILHDNVNRVDFALLHAYRFARAFEERGGVLPDVDEFKPCIRKQ